MGNGRENKEEMDRKKLKRGCTENNSGGKEPHEESEDGKQMIG